MSSSLPPNAAGIPDDLRSLTSYIRVPIFPAMEDDPALPGVLLMGDSISMYYTPEVRRLLQGRANVHRVPDNGKSTLHGLANLERWLGGRHWSIIHFNFGLHDIAVTAAGTQQVPLCDYETNLRRIVRTLRATGARLVWASTTPVPEGSRNRSEMDAVAYNAAAWRVMEESGIPVNDLHAFVLSCPNRDLLQLPANVHFRAEGSVELASEVAKAILRALSD
jgi:hypothetical protein